LRCGRVIPSNGSIRGESRTQEWNFGGQNVLVTLKILVSAKYTLNATYLKPASITRTEKAGFSDSLAAITLPAVPANMRGGVI
jgi:hypothetical protein